MCILCFASCNDSAHSISSQQVTTPRVSFVLCFNRDVLKERPFELPTFHSNGLFYGLDGPSGGTWLSVAPDGGFVAVLDHDELKEDAISKGDERGLPRGLLVLQRQTQEAKTAVPEWWRYAGYNMVQGNINHSITTWVVHTNRPKSGSDQLLFPLRGFDLSGNAFALANGSIARGPAHGGPKVLFAQQAAATSLRRGYEEGLSTEELAAAVRDDLAMRMSRDEPFREGLPPLDQYKPGVYESLAEFERCQAPFVTKLPSWATVSQQIIVRVDGRIFHYCRATKGPDEWKSHELCVTSSAASL